MLFPVTLPTFNVLQSSNDNTQLSSNKFKSTKPESSEFGSINPKGGGKFGNIKSNNTTSQEYYTKYGPSSANNIISDYCDLEWNVDNSQCITKKGKFSSTKLDYETSIIQPRPRILIQSRPKIAPIKETNPMIQSGPIDMNMDTYSTNELSVISAPNSSSKDTKDYRTLAAMKYIPFMKNLPEFIYQEDPVTGTLTRYLAVEEDHSYDTDIDYGISQEWLLSQRQGDQYDRVSERIPYPEIARSQEFNEQGVTLLNQGRVWYGPPKPQMPPPRSAYYDEYNRYLEYSRTQIEENDTLS